MDEPYHKVDIFTSSLIHGSSTEKWDLINALEHIAAIDIITRPQNSAHVWNCEYFWQICAHGSHCLHKQTQLVYIACVYRAHVIYYKIKFDTEKKCFFVAGWKIPTALRLVHFFFLFPMKSTVTISIRVGFNIRAIQTTGLSAIVILKCEYIASASPTLNILYANTDLCIIF